jgi:hypothetical protein
MAASSGYWEVSRGERESEDGREREMKGVVSWRPAAASERLLRGQGKQEVVHGVGQRAPRSSSLSQRRRQESLAYSPLALEGFPGKSETAQVLV